MELFDSHAHYNDEKFNNDREEVIKIVYNSGVTKLINAGYSLQSSKVALDIANAHSFMYATAGISPNDIPGEVDDESLEGKTEAEKKQAFENSMKIFEEQMKEIEEIARSKKVVAIGEIGLDYHWNKDNKELQRTFFAKQIELANKLNLPIVIHTREAVMDTLDILKNVAKPKLPGVFHCCPLNVELVKEALKLGFYISFAGPVTFKNSKNATEIAQMVPLDKMLIETDSPYLAPEPVRGTRNDSRNVKYVLEKLAEFKNVPPEELARQTYKNAETVMQLI